MKKPLIMVKAQIKLPFYFPTCTISHDWDLQIHISETQVIHE